MARHRRGSADREDPGQQGFAFWRRRQRAEAEAREAREAEAREAQTTAEQEARTARGQVAAARQERDEAVAAAQSRAAEAESRAGEAGAELQRLGADRDEAGGQPARQQPQSTTRRGRHPRQR